MLDIRYWRLRGQRKLLDEEEFQRKTVSMLHFDNNLLKSVPNESAFTASKIGTLYLRGYFGSSLMFCWDGWKRMLFSF